MIIPMTRVRIAGPRARLDRSLAVLQDAGVVHLVTPARDAAMVPHDEETRHLGRILGDVETALRLLEVPTDGRAPAAPPDLPRSALRAGRVRRRVERLARALAALEDERTLLRRYAEFFKAFEALLGEELGWPDGHAFYVVLRAGASDAVERLRASLEAAVGGEMELLARPLESGETAVLLLASSDAAPNVARLLAASRVQELPAPKGLGETSVLRALPALRERLKAIPKEIDALEVARAALRDEHGAALGELRAWLHDRLLLLDARGQAHAGSHLFVLEGWVPEMELSTLIARASAELGDEVVVEGVATEPWSRADAPVALANPALFRPFEVITRTLPLPKYGTIDPTPFVAVFFPMFFGLMLGDVGYGALLALLALVLGLRAPPNTALRSVSLVAGASAAFAIIFGFVFGELFGPTGRDAFGMRALFDREEAIVPFLGLTVALGVVHVGLGLVLAVVNAWRLGERRQAMGRGVAAVMVALTVVAILAALRVLPSGLFTPLAIAVLVAFPLLVALEGVVAVVELLSAFGHMLSYARIMALGTASLMLAMVANEMVGAMGSVLVGVLFALLFHAVNFAIGLFSPTIHALRLHYVEFFGKFFSPGGTAYRPFGHWHPATRG